MATLPNIRLNRQNPPDAAASPAEQRPPESERMETVGRLVGAVAHDFANILTLIAGYSDILLSRIAERDPLRPELDEIRKASNRGARLTAQLLGFTRGQPVQPRPLNLNSVVRDLERMLRLIIGECVELELELHPVLHDVFADPGQMEQVLMNLVLNARDAVPAGGRIRIETAECEIGEAAAWEFGLQPGPYVTLSIADNGQGIAPEAMKRIFEPFFTTKEHGKGTGLGLSTVQRIATESGGGIRVLSSPGNGATFTMCLPRAVQGSPCTEMSIAAVPAGAGSETLLVVEDEDGVRRLLTHVLRRRGYQVLEAADGQEALEIFRRRAGEISLVLTDMVMPRLDGRKLGDLLQHLRPGVRIIYMSGYTDDVLVRTGALCPGMSFLQKPLRPEVLSAKVREALDAVEPLRAAAN